MENNRGKSVSWGKTFSIFLVVFGLSFTYAVIRYNVIRDVPIENIPLFISNKAIALAATILIGISFILGPLTRFFPKKFEKHLYLRKHLGLFGFGIAALHALMSLALLGPAYYSKFYDVATGKFNLIGESTLLFGILAFLIFSIISITSLPPIEKHMHPSQWKFVQRMGYLAYGFVLLHVVTMGFKGWLHASSYQYGFISVSLVSALVIILVLLLRILVIIFPKK